MFKRQGLVGLALMVILTGFFTWSGNAKPSYAETLDELREELDQRRNTLKSAEEKIRKFKEEVQLKKKEARTLEDQIEIIEDTITELSLTIEHTIAEIDETTLEIDNVEVEIKDKEIEIDDQKELLSEYLRAIYELNQQSTVTVFLKYSTLSEVLNETNTIEELQVRSHDALVSIRDLKSQLEQQHSDLQDFRDVLGKLQDKQEKQQATLSANRDAKENVLGLTKEQEKKFASLLDAAKKAHQVAESDIQRIDAQIRERLKAEGIGSLPSIGTLDWPVSPIFGISCGFHCAGYPYAYLIGPHSGIDIPTHVGTPIKAPADGYVGRVHNANGPGYSYILMVHGDEVSTVYGHISGFAVGEGELVTRGTVIGFTGGSPGSSGAGLSSGPHLHFEVRVDNVPVNPTKYF